MDISKCDGVGCDRKRTCFRYTAEADPIYQSYISPINRGKKCDDYWGTVVTRCEKCKYYRPLRHNFVVGKGYEESHCCVVLLAEAEREKNECEPWVQEVESEDRCEMFIRREE